MNTKSSLLRASALVLLLSGTWLHAAVIFDSLGSTVNGSVGAGSGVWWGQSFVVDANNHTLTSVVLDISGMYGGAGGNFFVSIYNATGVSSTPGSSLATLIGSADPSSAGNYTYTPAGTLNLAANTTYYVVAGVSSGSVTYIWNGSSSSPATGSTIGSSDSFDQGATWFVPDTSLTLAMQVNAVPEPVNMALGIFGVLLGGGQSFRWWNARRAKLSHS